MNATHYRLDGCPVLFATQAAAEAAAVARYVATGAEAEVRDAGGHVVYRLSYGD